MVVLPPRRDAWLPRKRASRPTDAQIDEMARRCLEACGSALGSAKKLSLDGMIAIYHARQPLRNFFSSPPGTEYFAYSVPGISLSFVCFILYFLAKKRQRDEKNKSICLNSKYKRSAPLLHTEAEGVRAHTPFAESFQQHKTSSSHHKFPLSLFFFEDCLRSRQRTIHSYKE